MLIGTYSFDADKTLTTSAETGSVSGAGNPYTIGLNNHKLTGSANNGITISNGKTLTIKEGTISGFNTALINNGVLNLENMTFYMFLVIHKQYCK